MRETPTHGDDADQGVSENEYTTIRVRHDTARSLSKRSTDDDNSYDDVVQRLLSVTEKDISLREAVEGYFNEFDPESIAGMSAWISWHEGEPTAVMFTINTGEAKLDGQHVVDTFGAEYRIRIDRPDDDPLRLRFQCEADPYGPASLETSDTIPIYLCDDLAGADPIPLDEGIERLKAKLLGRGEQEVETP